MRDGPAGSSDPTRTEHPPRGRLLPALRHVLLGGGFPWGGYDTGDETARSVFVQAGGRLRIVGVDVCPTVEWGGTRFEYLERFDADRGAFAEEALAVGVEASRWLIRRGGFDAGLRIRSALSFRHQEIARRRLILELPLTVETDEEVVDRRTWEESVAVIGRVDALGIALGVSSYELFGQRRYGAQAELTWYMGGD